MQNPTSIVVVLATGGTIAGAASDASDNVGYVAGTIEIARLLEAVPMLAGQPLEAEQVAQIDSKDMGPAVWSVVSARIAFQLARPEVCGVVVTHGTDTLEETAWLLQRVHAPAKPVVLTAAMRPSTALLRDGPQNLLDAVRLARWPGARGVVAVLAGSVYRPDGLRKAETYRTDAFDAGDEGPLGRLEEGRLRRLRDWPDGAGLAIDLPPQADAWPWVEIVPSHAGAQGRTVDLLCDAGVQGLVVAGTGNGTIHRSLDDALRRAAARGVEVLRTTRCARGVIVGEAAGDWPDAGNLTPQQARVELSLRLMAGLPTRR